MRGAVGFLTRFPVGGNERAWTAFRASPWAFPATGLLIGSLVGIAAATSVVVPDPTAAVAAGVAVYAVTGIVHLDGVADVGDAAVVHGDPGDRREVLKDTTVGVGAVAAVALVVGSLLLGFLGVARLPVRLAFGVVVASEVGAKLGMAIVAAVGVAPHDGLGSAFTSRSGPAALVPAVVVAVPAAGLGTPTATSAVALVGATVAGVVVFRWASALLGGTNGDVFGAVNELGRVAGLHAGVIAWTLS